MSAHEVLFPGMHDAMIRWMTITAVATGALCASWLMAFVGGGWKQGVFGYVAWALMPYVVVTAMLVCARLFQLARGVHLLCHWACILVALGGPLLYFDAMFVHVDAQGALVVLMVPVIQTVLGIAMAVVVIIWQWRISRSTAKPPRQSESIVSPTATALRPVTGWGKLPRIVFVLVIVAVLPYALISIAQNADSATIKVAKEVDAFIVQYCLKNSSLPASDILRGQFPNLNRDTGWFFYTNDKTYLIVQYPVRWSNKGAIGKPKTSEFTATVYAYTVDYHCGKDK